MNKFEEKLIEGLSFSQSFDTKWFKAAINGDIKELRKNKKYIESVDIKDEYGETALTWASGYKNIAIIKYLLKNNVNVNIQNQWGYTALIIATKEKALNVVKILLEADADMDIQDKWGYTALDYAKKENNPDIIELLQKKRVK